MTGLRMAGQAVGRLLRILVEILVHLGDERLLGVVHAGHRTA